jgi:UDP-N-acetyl-D-mannosaminuronate dehydrogenase
MENKIHPKTIRSICCVGAGYVGGPTAAVLALKNPSIQVTVVDRDDRRIRRWNSRHLPIYEPGLAEVVRIARDGMGAQDSDATESLRKPNLFFSAEVSRCISEADAVLIAVNTPTKMRGTGKGCATDMTSFEAVAAEVVRHARDGTIIVEKSTVPCRTAQMIQEMVRSLSPPGLLFCVLFCLVHRHEPALTGLHRSVFKGQVPILKSFRIQSFWLRELLCKIFFVQTVLLLDLQLHLEGSRQRRRLQKFMRLGLTGQGSSPLMYGHQSWPSWSLTRCLRSV